MKWILALVASETSLVRMEESSIEVLGLPSLTGSWMATVTLAAGMPILFSLTSKMPNVFAIYPSMVVPICGNMAFPECQDYDDHVSNYVGAACSAGLIAQLCLNRLSLLELKNNERVLRRWQGIFMQECLADNLSYDECWDRAILRMKREIQDVPLRRRILKGAKQVKKSKSLASEAVKDVLTMLDQSMGCLKS